MPAVSIRCFAQKLPWEIIATAKRAAHRFTLFDADLRAAFRRIEAESASIVENEMCKLARRVRKVAP